MALPERYLMTSYSVIMPTSTDSLSTIGTAPTFSLIIFAKTSEKLESIEAEVALDIMESRGAYNAEKNLPPYFILTML